MIWDDVVGSAEREAYAHAGWGGRVGFGDRPAVAVVDMYRAFVEPAQPLYVPGVEQAVESTVALLAVARAAGAPVFYSRGAPRQTQAARGRWKTSGPGAQLGRDAYELCEALAPQPGEEVLVKSFPSAFFGTPLASWLVQLGVDTLVVTGVTTSGCVRATCVDGFSHGYRIVVPHQCVCDRGPLSQQFTLFEIHMKYGDVVDVSEVAQRLRGALPERDEAAA